MTSARKVLLFGGIAIALLGMAYGFWYAVFAEHQALDGMGASLTSSFGGAAERNPAQVARAMTAYQAVKYNYDRQVDAHSHWIGLAMVLIVLGIGFDYMSFSEKQKFWLASCLTAGSVLFPSGVLLQTMNHGTIPKIMAAAGAGLVAAALGAAIIGVLRRSRAAQPS